MPKAQEYLAIKRHLLGNSKRNFGGVPMLLSDWSGLDLEFYSPPDAPGITLPVNYLIIPVTTYGDWDGLRALYKLTDKEKKIRRTFSTLTLPQLAMHTGTDRVATLQVTSNDFQTCKKIAGDHLTEVNSAEELFEKYGELLPEEPVYTKLPKPLKGMLSRVPDGPLHGVLVVAFDQQIAGSLAAEVLARAGATVIKIEKKDSGDPKRHNSTPTAFNTFNAGKFSIVFDNSPEDQRLKTELLAKADVIIDNRSERAQNRDDALQNTLRKANREKPLIYCAISGFGRGTELPAYDRVVQAAAGMAELNGRLIAFPLIDMATGNEAAREISNYLFRRERMSPRELKARPCIRLDISMAATALNMMANPIATYMDTGQAQSTIVPFDLYEAKDGKIAVAVATDEQFHALCESIGADELKLFKTNQERQQHKEVIEAALHEKLKHKTIAEWLDIFKARNISASAVVSLKQAIASYGHDIIKPTKDGGSFVTSPTRSNAYPRNPHIGHAPAHNADKLVVKALVEHLEQEQDDPHALRHALMVASDAPDKSFQLKYQFVDLRDLDFNAEQSNVPWAKDRFFNIRKIGKVRATPAAAGEVVDIVHNKYFTDKAVAMEGDWKITTSFGDQYLLSAEKFCRNYLGVTGTRDEYAPNPELKPRKAIKVAQNIRFMSPSNDTNYIPKGGWIVQGSDGPYGIHPNNIRGNYEITSQWVDATARSRKTRKHEK